MLNDAVSIASFPAERKLAQEVARTLTDAKIEHAIEGSRVYEVLVPAAARERAIAILACSPIAFSLRFR